MNGAEIGAALAVILAALINALFDRADKRKAAADEINVVPDAADKLAAFRQRMRDKRDKNHVQP
jgi:hypothetical protein